MDLKTSNKEPDKEADFFDSLEENGQELRVIPPLSLWQKFWRNIKLRIAVGVLLLLVILGGAAVYFYSSYQSSSQVLTDYVPGSTWLYMEFNFDSNQWEQLQQQAPQLASATNDFFIQQGLNQDLINLSSRIALVGSLEDDGLAWVWLLKTPQPRQLEIFLEPGTFLRQPGTQVAAVSIHPQAVKRFNYFPGRAPIIPQTDSLWFGFVMPNELANYYNDASERNIATPLLAAWLQKHDKAMPLSIINREDFIILSLGTTANTEIVWPDFVSDYDLVLSNINITKTLTQLESAVARLPLAQFFWQSIKEQSAANFVLNWHSLQNHLNQPATVAITNRQPWENFSSPSELSLDFDDYELIINLMDDTPEIEQFASDLIRHYIAYRFPSEVERSLPDDSTVYDLIIDFDQQVFTVDPERKTWQTINSPDETIGYTMWSTGKFLTVANQSEVSAIRMSGLRDTEFACGDLNGEQIYINHNLLNFIPLLQDFSEIMITSSAEGLKACLR